MYDLGCISLFLSVIFCLIRKSFLREIYVGTESDTFVVTKGMINTFELYYYDSSKSNSKTFEELRSALVFKLLKKESDSNEYKEFPLPTNTKFVDNLLYINNTDNTFVGGSYALSVTSDDKTFNYLKPFEISIKEQITDFKDMNIYIGTESTTVFELNKTNTATSYWQYSFMLMNDTLLEADRFILNYNNIPGKCSIYLSSPGKRTIKYEITKKDTKIKQIMTIVFYHFEIKFTIDAPIMNTNYYPPLSSETEYELIALENDKKYNVTFTYFTNETSGIYLYYNTIEKSYSFTEIPSPKLINSTNVTLEIKKEDTGKMLHYIFFVTLSSNSTFKEEDIYERKDTYILVVGSPGEMECSINISNPNRTIFVYPEDSIDLIKIFEITKETENYQDLKFSATLPNYSELDSTNKFLSIKTGFNNSQIQFSLTSTLCTTLSESVTLKVKLLTKIVATPIYNKYDSMNSTFTYSYKLEYPFKFIDYKVSSFTELSSPLTHDLVKYSISDKTLNINFNNSSISPSLNVNDTIWIINTENSTIIEYYFFFNFKCPNAYITNPIPSELYSLDDNFSYDYSKAFIPYGSKLSTNYSYSTNKNTNNIYHFQVKYSDYCKSNYYFQVTKFEEPKLISQPITINYFTQRTCVDIAQYYTARDSTPLKLSIRNNYYLHPLENPNTTYLCLTVPPMNNSDESFFTNSFVNHRQIYHITIDLSLYYLKENYNNFIIQYLKEPYLRLEEPNITYFAIGNYSNESKIVSSSSELRMHYIYTFVNNSNHNFYNKTTITTSSSNCGTIYIKLYDSNNVIGIREDILNIYVENYTCSSFNISLKSVLNEGGTDYHFVTNVITVNTTFQEMPEVECNISLNNLPDPNHKYYYRKFYGFNYFIANGDNKGNTFAMEIKTLHQSEQITIFHPDYNKYGSFLYEPPNIATHEGIYHTNNTVTFTNVLFPETKRICTFTFDLDPIIYRLFEGIPDLSSFYCKVNTTYLYNFTSILNSTIRDDFEYAINTSLPYGSFNENEIKVNNNKDNYTIEWNCHLLYLDRNNLLYSAETSDITIYGINRISNFRVELITFNIKPFMPLRIDISNHCTSNLYSYKAYTCEVMIRRCLNDDPNYKGDSLDCIPYYSNFDVTLTNKTDINELSISYNYVSGSHLYLSYFDLNNETKDYSFDLVVKEKNIEVDNSSYLQEITKEITLSFISQNLPTFSFDNKILKTILECQYESMNLTETMNSLKIAFNQQMTLIIHDSSGKPNLTEKYIFISSNITFVSFVQIINKPKTMSIYKHTVQSHNYYQITFQCDIQSDLVILLLVRNENHVGVYIPITIQTYYPFSFLNYTAPAHNITEPFMKQLLPEGISNEDISTKDYTIEILSSKKCIIIGNCTAIYDKTSYFLLNDTKVFVFTPDPLHDDCEYCKIY